MSRQANGSGRYYVTLDRDDADALEAAAHEAGRPPTTEAGLRIVETLRGADRDALADALRDLAATRRELEQVQAAYATIRRRTSLPEGTSEPRMPRWEWPLEDLLADRDWWHVWLPRLHQLIGRPSAPVFVHDGGCPLDGRGYVDVMATLLPPIPIGDGTVVDWSSHRYPEAARRRAAGSVPGSVSQADVWEPLLRHVTVALCDLELAAAPGTSPALRIRTEEELIGPWLQTLRRLTGDAPANLAGPPG